ncbi:MAG: hypothetical protein U0Z17_05960 [Bacteroidales bacterium]
MKEKGADEIFLEFGHATSEGGAAKWFSFVTTAPGLYTPKAGTDYSICFLTSVADNPEIPLFFKSGFDGNCSLNATFNSDLFDFVQLEDIGAGTFYDLKLNSVFTFTASAIPTTPIVSSFIS